MPRSRRGRIAHDLGVSRVMGPTELEQFRERKDRFFVTGPDSPLTREQKTRFRGLSYFPENPNLVIEAELDADVNPEVVVLQTSTRGTQTYRRAGVVRFEVDGRPAQLTLFAGEGERDLFVPFRDATSGGETYGAGRYLEVEPPKNGAVVVDFNYAYNPYCAFNDRWSCPIPPRENWLNVPIRAGEKAVANSVR